jgi:hypothetical protein
MAARGSRVRRRGWFRKTQRPRRPYFAGLEFAGRPREVSADSRKQRSTGTLMTLLVPEYFSLIRAAERR